MTDTDLAAQVVLLVDGAYAVGGSRRDPAAARGVMRKLRWPPCFAGRLVT